MILKSLDILNTLGLSKLGHFRNRQNIFFVFKNGFPYSADVKPTVNKSRFDFIYWHHRACSFYVHTTLFMILKCSMH